MMTAERGQHFDPDLLDSFIAGFDAFCDIARLHPDEEPAPLLASDATQAGAA